MTNLFIQTSADFSPNKTYRYALWRTWGGITGYVMFIGLNPSTADEETDDNTIRRCIKFARDWGYSGLCMTNLFAYRATKPKDMKAASDPIGPDNDQWLKDVASQASIIIAAWGNDGSFKGRDKIVRQLIPNLNYLRLTGKNQPEHPLYLPMSLTPIEWKLSLTSTQ